LNGIFPKKIKIDFIKNFGAKILYKKNRKEMNESSFPFFVYQIINHLKFQENEKKLFFYIGSIANIVCCDIVKFM